MSLIAPSALLAAYKKWEQAESAKAATPAPVFKYQPRSRQHWQSRVDQNKHGCPAPLAHAATPVTPANENEPAITPAIKVSGKTPCVCGHPRKLHCIGQPKLHTPNDAAPYWCATEHCLASKWNVGMMEPCACAIFQAFADAPVKTKAAKADDYTPCGNCNHWRAHHCKKHLAPRAPKPGSKPRRPKWTVTDTGAILHERDKWKGFRDKRGEVAACQHTTPDGKDYVCNSTSCAEGDEATGQFCPCEKFVNPLATPRSRKKKVETLAAVQAELFQLGETI
jgi:hypothetical protein